VDQKENIGPKEEVDPKEQALAQKASREMRTAVLVIVGSLLFVLVAVVLIVVIGHIQLF
jgi:hypothetical protein